MEKQNTHNKIMRRLIFDTMVALLEEKPFSKITVQDILDRAEIQRATFYRYYKDKYEVVEEINSFLANSYAQMYIKSNYLGHGINQNKIESFWNKHGAITKNLLYLKTENINLLKDMYNAFIAEYQKHFSDCKEYETYLAAHNFISMMIWHAENITNSVELNNFLYSDAQIRWLARFHTIPVSKFTEFIEQNKMTDV